MKLLLNFRRKSSARGRSLDLAPLTELEVDDVKCPPPPAPSPSSMCVSRCASLTSMDSMAAALALTPVSLTFAGGIGNSFTDGPLPSMTHAEQPESPRVAPLVATVGPTNLRSNLRCAARPKRSRRSKTTVAYQAESALREDIAATFGANVPSSPRSQPVSGSLPDLLSSACRRRSGSAESSTASTPFVMTPADLTPVQEVPTVPGPLVPTSPKPSMHPLSSPSSPVLATRRRSSVEGVKAYFAPLLSSKSSFSPTRLSVVSPTGSSFGGDSPSPTVSFFHNSEGSHRRRSLGSLFASDDSPVDPVFTGLSQSGSAHTFGGAVILLDTPAVDTPVHVSPFRSPKNTSTRLAERRPINLDLSAASRRPHSRAPFHSTRSPSFQSPRTPPITPETDESLSAQQDSKPAGNTNGTAPVEQLEETLQWILNTPPETPPDHTASLPRVKPLDFPPLIDANGVKEYRKGPRKLSAVVEGASPV